MPYRPIDRPTDRPIVCLVQSYQMPFRWIFLLPPLASGLHKVLFSPQKTPWWIDLQEKGSLFYCPCIYIARRSTYDETSAAVQYCTTILWLLGKQFSLKLPWLSSLFLQTIKNRVYYTIYYYTNDEFNEVTGGLLNPRTIRVRALSTYYLSIYLSSTLHVFLSIILTESGRKIFTVSLSYIIVFYC